MLSSLENPKSELAINEELAMHKRGWKIQRIGLLLVVILALCCSAGLFGDGIASRRAMHGEQASVEFDRFYRFQAKMKIQVEMNSETANVVSFQTSYLRNFEIESIVPEPSQNEFNGENIDYKFNGTGLIDVTFYLVPQTVGTIDGRLKVGENTFALHHFIYP